MSEQHATATTLGSAAAGVRWRDPKRLLWALGLLVPLLPFGARRMADLTGWTVMWWYGPLVVFVLVPVLDQLIGKDASNPPDAATGRLEANRYYRWLTFLFIPIQYASLVYACAIWTRRDLPLLGDLGLAVTVGVVGGIAINTAHELGHKREWIERWLSKIALAQSAYGHFHVEHNRGHHVRVATPEDPASARLGEGFWAFLPRTVIGSLRSAIDLERSRLARQGRTFWTPRNHLLNAWAMTVVLFGGLIVAFGWQVAPWLAVQAVVGFGLLEIVNYLEHYGLCRERLPSGRYERCRPEHSWNSDNAVSNLFLYQLQRHSDHHANPTRRYQSLRHVDTAPELPSGYATMIVLAAVPPLWRRVMDDRVVTHYGGKVTRANIHPRARARLMARYGCGG